jgi:thiol:disulfide interchange protein
MHKLQRFLAIPMGATAVAALWLLYREAGQQALWIGVGAAAVLAVALAIIGRNQRVGSPVPLFGLALVGVTLVAAIGFAPDKAEVSPSTPQGAGVWSEAAVNRALAQGHPVFVYFTADWCLTCKVNEAAAIDRKPVRDAFKAAGVQVFAGDWTNGDPEITRFLEGRGRAGVPVYLWYAPGKPVEELPQVLTPAMLISRAQARQQR